MPEPIISVSGLRGVIGETLNPEVAIRYAAAFADSLPPGDFVIGRDSRPSGQMLSQAIQAGLQSVGRNTIDAGIVATPTLGILVRKYQAVGGIQITASHNPSPYNGLKLFSGEGRVISAGPGQKVLDRYRKGKPAWCDHTELGRGFICDDSLTAHLIAVLNTVDAPLIRQQHFRVVLDSNRGAGSILGRRLMHELSCRVIVLGEEPDGQFEHPPEPTAENLASMLSAVPANSAQIGFCQDPDADRLAVIDENGRYLGEEYTLALCVDHILRQKKGPIVTNCSSSRMSQDIAIRHGASFHHAAVGEANVADAMLKHKAIFGGEGNGGPIDPRVGYVRDSFVGMAILLDAMAAQNRKISEMADELPRYEIVKTKMSLPGEKIPAALDALEKRFPDAKPDRLDGLRLDWKDHWLLVRGSNTEPIVRAIAEAPTEEAAKTLCESAAEALAEIS